MPLCSKRTPSHERFRRFRRYRSFFGGEKEGLEKGERRPQFFLQAPRAKFAPSPAPEAVFDGKIKERIRKIAIPSANRVTTIVMFAQIGPCNASMGAYLVRFRTYVCRA
jgi:hypothetical protein